MPGLAGGSNGLAFGIYAALGYDVMSATNSSPQTTELFASDRSGTLMKWVHLGGIQGLALGLFGSYLEKSVWPMIGVTVSMGIMYVEYGHAVKSGKANPPPSAMTEYNSSDSGGY